MKLLLCKSCQDIIKLVKTPRTCQCGKVGGHYIDDIQAVYFGDDAIPMGINNESLMEALIEQKYLGDPKKGGGD